jgi:hypothetical protein
MSKLEIFARTDVLPSLLVHIVFIEPEIRIRDVGLFAGRVLAHDTVVGDKPL